MAYGKSCDAELSPLTVRVEKGSVSRLFLKPMRSAYLNVSSTLPAKANPDEFQSLATNEGLVYVQYSASGTTNTKFTASMGENQTCHKQPVSIGGMSPFVVCHDRTIQDTPAGAGKCQTGGG